jgi:hypothetical protein
MVRLTLYVKEGCWLCDAAEETLAGLRERYGLFIDRVLIDTDPALHELYRFDVPVLEFEDGIALSGRIRKKDLLRCLDANKK